jgi:hypothetical protein
VSHPLFRPGFSPIVSPPIAGSPRRKVQSEPAITNDESGPAYTNPTPSFRIITPSIRLVVLFALTFDPDRQPPQSGPGAFLLTADAYVRGSREQGGTPMRANNIVTDIALPWSLNVPLQGVDQINGSIVLPYPSGIDQTILWVTVVWEPAPGDDIPDDELQHMFGLCSVTIGGGGNTNKTGGL